MRVARLYLVVGFLHQTHAPENITLVEVVKQKLTIMNQIQCPNCKSYKVVLQSNIPIIAGFVLGAVSFVFLFLFFPLGILMGLAALVIVIGGSIRQMAKKSDTFFCQDCSYRFQKHKDNAGKQQPTKQSPKVEGDVIQEN